MMFIATHFIQPDVSRDRNSDTLHARSFCWTITFHCMHASFHLNKQPARPFDPTASIQKRKSRNLQLATRKSQRSLKAQTSTSLPIPSLLRIFSLSLPLRDQRLAVILAIRQPVDRVDMTFRRRSVGQEDYARASKEGCGSASPEKEKRDRPLPAPEGWLAVSSLLTSTVKVELQFVFREFPSRVLSADNFYRIAPRSPGAHLAESHRRMDPEIIRIPQPVPSYPRKVRLPLHRPQPVHPRLEGFGGEVTVESSEDGPDLFALGFGHLGDG
jgi:hypothetical protein